MRVCRRGTAGSVVVRTNVLVVFLERFERYDWL